MSEKGNDKATEQAAMPMKKPSFHMEHRGVASNRAAGTDNTRDCDGQRTGNKTTLTACDTVMVRKWADMELEKSTADATEKQAGPAGDGVGGA